MTCNAIVLVRDRRLVGMGSGQTSRVDAARQAVAKAQAMLGPDATVGAACASDAFFPFPDAVEACLAAGVRAFAQPGGSRARRRGRRRRSTPPVARCSSPAPATSATKEGRAMSTLVAITFAREADARAALGSIRPSRRRAGSASRTPPS